ncbi:phage tail protein [Lacticaseibacillus sharpeae]|uniref:phage tail protein n=1 Tax=Lacticaseibacillus sharpeae TaxID=1626 RepID=UPI000A8ACAA1|nr:phage tail protein [Lacticaseibacillus sharpeae]
MDYLFVDRMRRLIATVPTDSVDGLCISSDDEIVTINGSRNLTLELTYSADTVLLAAKTGAIGNLVMYKDEDKNPVVMEIVKSVRDPLNYTYTLSADTAGADLIDETVDTYDADDEYTIDYYVDKFTWDSGWEIRLNQVTEKALKLKYDNEDETALARALNVASDFGAELDFAFTIDTDHTVHKYIDIYAARGSQTNAELVRDINVNNVTSTTDIYDMFTSVKAKSDVNDKDGNPITLKGMTWQSDDGRYVLGSDGILRDTVAVHKWSRILSEDNPDPSTHHLQRVKKYTTGLDTASDDNPKYKQYPDKVEAKNKDIASQKKKITATDAYIKSQNGYIAKKQKYIAECNARIAAYEKKQKYTYPAKKAAYLVKVKSLQAELAKGGTASHVKSLANQIATQQRLAANQDKYAAKQSKYIAKQQAYIKAANAAIKGYKKKIADYNAKIKGYNATIDKDNSDITDLNAGKVALYNDVQSKTLDLALADLKAHNEPAVNYETDIALLPDTVRLGDTVHIVDDEEGTYLSSRVLQIETSRAAGTRVATMGNYLIEQRQAENADAALAQKIDYATQGLQKDSAQGKKFQAEIDERLANADTEAAQLEQKLTDNKAYYDKEVSDLNAAVATAQQAAIDTAKTDLETTMGTYKGEVDKQFKEYNDGYDLKLTEADGRISTLTDSIDGFQAKVEDTVTGISSKFDVLSDSVNATISKDNLQALFAVQIQDGTASIVDRLTDAEGNIEATTKLANGIQQSVESLTTNTSTQINQLSDLIDLRATSADVKARLMWRPRGLTPQSRVWTERQSILVPRLMTLPAGRQRLTIR